MARSGIQSVREKYGLGGGESSGGFSTGGLESIRSIREKHGLEHTTPNATKEFSFVTNYYKTRDALDARPKSPKGASSINGVQTEYGQLMSRPVQGPVSPMEMSSVLGQEYARAQQQNEEQLIKDRNYLQGYTRKYNLYSQEELQNALKSLEARMAGGQRRGYLSDEEQENARNEIAYLNAALGLQGYGDQNRLSPEIFGAWRAMNDDSVSDKSEAQNKWNNLLYSAMDPNLIQQDVDAAREKTAPYENMSYADRSRANTFQMFDALGLPIRNLSQRETPSSEEWENIKTDYNLNKGEADRLQSLFDSVTAAQYTPEQERKFLDDMAVNMKDYTDSDAKTSFLRGIIARNDENSEYAKQILEQYEYNMSDNKFLTGVGAAALSGVGTVDKMFASVPAAIGDVFGVDIRDTGYYKFLAGNSDAYMEQSARRKDLYKNYTDNAFLQAASNAGRSLIEGTVQSLPFLMTGGATSAADALASTSAKATSTVGQMISYSGSQMFSNPGYWLAFAQEYGNQYEDAIKNGATQEQAAISSLVAGTLNGGIEIGFGVQANVDDVLASNSFREFMSEALSSAIEEGGEELAQGFTGNLVDYLVWDRDKKAVSFDRNANAILNVPNMWEEFKGGFFGSWGFGGIQIAQSVYAGKINDTNKRRLMELSHQYMSGEFSDWLLEHGSAMPGEESDYLARLMSGMKLSSQQAEQLRNSPAAVQFLNEFTKIHFDSDMSAEAFRRNANGLADAIRTGVTDYTEQGMDKYSEQRSITRTAERLSDEIGVSADTEAVQALAKVYNGDTISAKETRAICNNADVANYVSHNLGIDIDTDTNSVMSQINEQANGTKAITSAMQTAMNGDTITDNQAKAIADNAPAREYIAATTGVSADSLTTVDAVKQAVSNQAAKTQLNNHGVEKTVKSLPKKKISLNPAAGKINTENGVQDVEVHDFADAKAGTVYLSDGSTAKVSDVAFEDSERAAVYHSAMKYDTDTANVFINGYQGQTGYAAAFDRIYDLGRNGGNFTAEYAKVKDSITPRAAIAAYGRGRQNDTSAREITRTKNVKGGGVVKDYNESRLSRKQKASVEVVEALGKMLGITFVVHDTGRVKSGGIVLDVNGFFNQSDNTVHLSLNSIDGLILRTAGHELTHFMKKWNPKGYEAYRDVLKEEIGDERWEKLIQEQMNLHKTNRNKEVSREYAEEEVVADASERYLNDIETFKKLAERNKSAAQKLLDGLKEFIQKLKEIFTGSRGAYSLQSTMLSQLENFEQIRDQWADALGEAAETFRATAEDASVGNESNDIDFSIKSLSSAMGVQAYRDEVTGQISFFVDGEAVNHISSSDVRDSSGIGLLITQSVKSGFISESEAKTQYRAAADLMNMIMKTQDPELTWAWAGSSIFSALKKNSDGQYGTTIDFTTVCRKTQEMVTAMSSAMKRLGRGLTKAEVTQLQRRILESGAEVPCPVCYVFSRWAGIGGMLDDIMRLQNKYADMSQEESRQRVAELEQEIIDRGWGTKSRRGKWSVNGTAVTKLMQEKEGQRMDLSAELEMLETAKRDTARQKELRSQIKDLDVEIGILSEWTWVKNIISRADYKAVPASVLFDLDKGAEFAKNYAAVWKYRTTRGPSSGKAILPYSDMRFGDIIIGADKANKLTVTGTEYARKSPFVDTQDNVIAKGSFTSEQQRAYRSALLRTAAQNLIGGQRFQSTSDFRYEYALDYLQAFWELQALGSKMQTYTKVVEFADMVAAVGGDVNLSVMPKGKGYSNGKLVFSNVTGMNIDAALEANAKFDNAQLILVGINDEHILLALEDNASTGGENIGFVIPYHASGASIEEFISELVQNLGEKFVKTNYQDYSSVQTDSQIKGATAEQKRRAEIRKLILQQKGASKVRNTLSNEDMALIRGTSVDITGRSFEDLRAVEVAALNGDEAAMREYLSWSAGVLNDLYEKMYNGAEKQTFLSSSQAAAIMPHEYWNRNTTRANAYVNGFIFRSYCQSLGLHPRFTGWSSEGQKNFGDFSGSTGYWKTLIDRPMYANDGTYRDQSRINVTSFDNAMLTPDYAERVYPDYKIQEPNRTRAERVGEEFAEELSDDGIQFSLRTEPDPNQTETVYKLMRLGKDNKLYPLFIDSANPIEVGKWYDADSPDLSMLRNMPNGAFLVDYENGTYQSLEEYAKENGLKRGKNPNADDINKATAEGKRWIRITDTSKGQKNSRYGESRLYDNYGINGSGSVETYAMRPGWHAGSLPSMLQIGKGANKNLRDDSFVWVRGSVPADVDYQEEANRNAGKDIPTHIPVNGYYLKATNANKAASQADVIGWYVAGSFRADEIISDREARRVIDDWNAEHTSDHVEYDYERESGMEFDAEQMKLVPKENAATEGDVKLSLNELDSAYLSAVESGNVEEQQRMVDEAAERAFADSKIRDEDGNLIKVYHGTDADFTVFDRSKGRSTMDIQGSFFSPWDIDARGYGSNVRAFYLNITNPAPEGIAYRALNRFKGQNDAGIKAREYLERLGYDGVNNSDEEYIAFNSEQIKSADPITYDDAGNVIPLSERFRTDRTGEEAWKNEDILYSLRKEVLDLDIEWDTNEYSTIPEQLVAHREQIIAHGTIARVEFGEESKDTIVKTMLDVVSMIGGKRIKNSGVTFDFDKNGAEAIKSHLHSKSEEEFVAAVVSPVVAKYGILITGHKNHKGQPKTTLTYAGRIEVNGELLNVGVAVQFSRNGRPQAVNAEQDTPKGKQKLREALHGKRRRTGQSLVTVLLTKKDFPASTLQHTTEKVKQEDSEISTQLKTFTGRTDTDLFKNSDGKINLTSDENRAVTFYQEAVDKVAFIENDIEKLTELRNSAKTQKQRDGFQQDIYRKEGQADTWREQIDLRSNTPEYKSALSKAVGYNLDQLLEKYGSIKPGFEPKREIHVPKKTSEDKKVRQTVRTVLESGAITDDMVDPIQREILNETFSYTAISDASSKDYAEKYIAEYGYEGGMEAWERAIRGDKLVGKRDIAIAEYLLQMAAKDGNTADVIKLVGEIAAEGTRAGQTVQALAMLKKLNSIESVHLGELYYIKKAVDQINREIEKKNKGRRKPFALLEIKENLANAIVNAQSEEEATNAAQELMKDLGAQLPSTWIDKWNAWRYLSMLGNPRTHIRNLVGNAIFVPAVKLKNVIGAGLEKFVKGERTKALRTTKEQRSFAANDFKEMEDVVSSGGKYNDTQSGIYAYKKIWKSKPGRILNFLAEKNSAFLEKEDWLFLRSHYISAMSQYMQANHIPVERMKENSPELEKARKYAIQEAQKATYRDASAVAQWLNKAEGIPVANLLVSGILPFKKTPINILKRGVEYSPLGLVKTLSKGVYDMRQGKITVNEWIDGIASGLSGTAVMALGMLLASLGVIQGGYDDDDEKNFDRLQGIQEYSIIIGDYTYTIDWAAPLSLPFFVGAEIFSAMKEESELSLKQILTAAQKITEPMFNLSMLSGLQDTLDAVSYSKNKLTAVGTQVLSSYLSQAFPTIGGQIARTVDKTRYKNYTTKDSIIPKDLQYFLQSLLLKVPGGGYLAGLEASTDVWGEEQTNGDSILLRAFENFMSPGYIEKIESNEVETEIGKLYDETGDKGVLPHAGNKYLTIDGQRVYFSSSDYAKYEKMRGQMSYEILRDLIGTEMYQNLDGERKAYLMGLVYHYASYTSGNTVNPNYHPSSYGWADKCTASSLESGIPIETYLYFRMQKHFDASNNKRDERVAVIDAMNIPADQKDELYLMDDLAKSKLDKTPWH